VTVSILQALAMLPTGEAGIPLSREELSDYLRDKAKLTSDGEKARNERHALRDRLYRDGGDDDMKKKIGEVFENEKVITKRRAFVELAKFSNVTKRIVGELSTVYAEPARRYVDGGAANQAKYDALLKALGFDEQMAVANQMLNLHRALLVGPRVRKNADGTREMVIDIATPSTVRAVLNPMDTTQVFGWLIRVDMPLARTPAAWGERKPSWVLWTDHEWSYLDERLMPLGAWVEHGLGLNRWVPLTYAATATPGFWPGCEGEDLVSAHMMGWLAAILMVKETKSNTKQPLVQGDVSAMARDQVADSDVPILAPEGVTVTTIDVGTDPDVFIKTESHALKRTGNNYGLSMDVIEQQGAQSADAREIILAPLRERRRKQITIMRRFEHRLAEVMARICEVDMPDAAFSVEGWRIDFGETMALLSKKERLDIFEKERSLGLTDTVAFIMSENPDIDEDTARADQAEHIANETERITLMRGMQALSGAMGTQSPAPDITQQQPPNAGPANAPPMAEAA
jgi:hypothetical protein